MRLPYWVKSAAIGLAAGGLAVVVVAGFVRSQGGAFTLTEGVQVAIVATTGTVLVALINRTREHAKAARVQVENNHTTNLREEGDERHEQNTAILLEIQGDIRGLRRDIGRLWSRDDLLDERIRDMEKTQPKGVADHG